MCFKLVPEPRMEGGRPRPPHADARLMDGLAACSSLKPCSCGARGRAPSIFFRVFAACVRPRLTLLR